MDKNLFLKSTFLGFLETKTAIFGKLDFNG